MLNNKCLGGPTYKSQTEPVEIWLNWAPVYWRFPIGMTPGDQLKDASNLPKTMVMFETRDVVNGWTKYIVQLSETNLRDLWVGPPTESSKLRQKRYERGLEGKRAVHDSILRTWKDEEVWAYQDGRQERKNKLSGSGSAS